MFQPELRAPLSPTYDSCVRRLRKGAKHTCTDAGASGLGVINSKEATSRKIKQWHVLLIQGAAVLVWGAVAMKIKLLCA